jgi:STE24 endopeptidase
MRRAVLVAPLAVAGALLAAQAAVVLLRPRSGVLEPDPVNVGEFFTPEQIERATDFRGPQLALYGVTLLIQAGVLAWLVVRARRRTPAAGSAVRRPILGAAAAGAGVALALALATLPVDAILRARAIDVGLVTRSWPGWAWDLARGAGIGALVTGAAAAAGIALMRRFPRRWWIPASGLVVAVGIAFTFAGPLVLDPVFNRFDRLPAGALRADVLALADRAGVQVGEVYVMDASKRTTAANAYVTGIGSSKRVVLYDTLVRDFPAAETRLVVAHELAHVRNSDVRGALIFLALVAPAGMFAASRLLRAWAPPGDTPPGPPSVPALVASVMLMTLLVGAASNGLSRRVEARADTEALTLTGDPATFIAKQRRLALRNVSDPDPPRVARVLLGTHPTTRQRLGIARAYEAGARP